MVMFGPNGRWQHHHVGVIVWRANDVLLFCGFGGVLSRLNWPIGERQAARTVPTTLGKNSTDRRNNASCHLADRILWVPLNSFGF